MNWKPCIMNINLSSLLGLNQNIFFPVATCDGAGRNFLQTKKHFLIKYFKNNVCKDVAVFWSMEDLYWDYIITYLILQKRSDQSVTSSHWNWMLSEKRGRIFSESCKTMKLTRKLVLWLPSLTCAKRVVFTGFNCKCCVWDLVPFTRPWRNLMHHH